MNPIPRYTDVCSVLCARAKLTVEVRETGANHTPPPPASCQPPGELPLMYTRPALNGPTGPGAPATRLCRVRRLNHVSVSDPLSFGPPWISEVQRKGRGDQVRPVLVQPTVDVRCRLAGKTLTNPATAVVLLEELIRDVGSELAR